MACEENIWSLFLREFWPSCIPPSHIIILYLSLYGTFILEDWELDLFPNTVLPGFFVFIQSVILFLSWTTEKIVLFILSII